MPPIPAADLRHLLVTILAGATDGDGARWDALVGAIERVDLTRSPHTNWTIVARGDAGDREAIDRAVALVRGEHPYVRW